MDASLLVGNGHFRHSAPSQGFSPLLHGRHAFTKQAAKAEKSMEAPEVAKCSNLKALSSEEKQALVRYWVQKQTIDLYERYANVMGEFEELNTTLREHLQQVKLDILRRAQLIGVRPAAHQTTAVCRTGIDTTPCLHASPMPFGWMKPREETPFVGILFWLCYFVYHS